MFPKSEFTYKKLTDRGISEEKINYFIEKCNLIGNLQLLDEIPNIEKKAMDFDIWVKERIPATELEEYKRKNFVPDVDLSFANFDIFFKEREKMLALKIKFVKIPTV